LHKKYWPARLNQEKKIMWARQQHDRRFQTGLTLVIGFILSLAALGLAADLGPLPATNWNAANLAKIKVSPGQPLRFAVLGDSRDNPDIFGAVLREVDRDPHLAFVIHLGDLVHQADLEQYRTFFRVVRQNLHKPLLMVIGNHELKGEGGLKLYHEIFGPDDYSFEINDNYFITLNDNDYQNGLSPAQFRWLEKELQKSQAYQTRLVFLHVPLFDPGSGKKKPHCLAPEAAGRLLALFKQYKVTQVFAGHIHAYFDGAWDEVPYVISGGAGAPLYGGDPKHSFFHYLKVTIQGGRVQVQVRPVEIKGRP
jgi:3',5'-cyclic AMP phosphodiesterase CpdA